MLKAISIVQRLAQVYTNSIFPYCGVSTIITIMPETIRNLLKQTGVFKCRHPAHKRFGYDVSPYHIMVKKGCYPDGCMEFLWRCRLLGKGKKCPRGYKHVGKGCFSCPEFYDEKLTFNPGSELNDKALNRFMEDLVEFRGWLETMRGRRIRFSGLVDSVKPHLRMTIESRGRRVRMDGYYAAFKGGYLDNDYFEDKIYLKLNTSFLERTEAAPGDRLELDAIFNEERGRIILVSPKNTEIERNGNRRALTPSRARVGRATGRIIEGSVVKCAECPYCSLMDIEDRGRRETVNFRRYYCLRGVSDSDNCPVRIEEIIREEKKKVRF